MPCSSRPRGALCQPLQPTKRTSSGSQPSPSGRHNPTRRHQSDQQLCRTIAFPMRVGPRGHRHWGPGRRRDRLSYSSPEGRFTPPGRTTPLQQLRWPTNRVCTGSRPSPPRPPTNTFGGTREVRARCKIGAHYLVSAPVAILATPPGKIKHE
ncbi:hypothetical protein NDU88_006902 [Pleurodeles waltl]|uniref:Uncharacterized protein n=1 Tax=Pleurodeles waltl TaxID=8319 RepID=A0AAV7QME9_PLEWA|nr:hypothetical protein NDU88_006902 [Pleurodeles waltl]